MGRGDKKTILTTGLAAVFAAGLAAAGSGAVAAAPDCADDAVTLSGPWGQARFSVEVADDATERAVGLMNREQMGRMSGMLFVYDRPQNVAFWMKNTLIPLDMLFLDETGTVRRIHENARPLDTTAIPGGEAIQYVLEINGGMARLLGITPGSVLSHPAIDPKLAAAPCGS